MNITALVFAVVGAAAIGVAISTVQPQSNSKGNKPKGKHVNTQTKLIGYRVENDRFAEGPYKGYLIASPKRADKFVKTDAEWKKILTPEQYRILRNQGTEPAFCGKFHEHKGHGIYHVVGGGLPVFSSDHKFNSGTGWPSFYRAVDKDAVWLRADFSHGMERVEVLDSKSDGHLGHVFPDGPSDKGGLRFCINSEVLYFVEKKD